jgi:hypothetical protein
MNQYTIEQIDNKYYIFNNMINEFLQIPFSTYKEAEEYISNLISMCDIMCN